MNKSEKSGEDILSRYINPGMVEKAPEGLAENIMTRIQKEQAYSPVRKRFSENFKIPAISLLIAVALIITASIVSSNDIDSAFFSLFDQLSEIKLSFPEFRSDIFSGFTMPGWMVYSALGIFFLSVFDRILIKFLHREKK
jgi:hypothetical protein